MKQERIRENAGNEGLSICTFHLTTAKKNKIRDTRDMYRKKNMI